MPAPGDRLPRPPRRRRPGFAALAVLLIVGAGATAGLLATQLDQREKFLAAKDDLSVGAQIRAEDLKAVELASSEDGGLIRLSQAKQVIGRYVSQPVPAGRLLDVHMFDTQGVITPGKAAAGIPLNLGKNAPAQLVRSGDRVDVIHTSDKGGVTVATDALVTSVLTSEGGGFGSSESSDTVITVIVRRADEAAAVAAASHADQVAIVLVGTGEQSATTGDPADGTGTGTPESPAPTSGTG